MSTEASAAMVQAKCVSASSVVVGTTLINNVSYYNITGTLPNGCNAMTYTPAKTYGTWFGWVVPAPFECVKGINPKETNPAQEDSEKFHHPVAFSFFKTTSMYSIITESDTGVWDLYRLWSR